MFDFQSEVSEKKFKDFKDVDPLLYSTLNKPEVYYIVDHPLPQPVLTKLIKLISMTNKGLEFQIISALPFEPQEKDLEKSIVNLYTNHGTDLKKYIPDWSKVVTIGRGLYSVTKSDDLSIEGCYDTIEWKTSFFAPDIKSYIYPCPSLFTWLDKDTFERYFSIKQMFFARADTYSPLRITKPNLVDFKTEKEVSDFLIKWRDYAGITAFDTETKTTDPWSPVGKIICLTLAFEADVNTAYFLPFNLIDINLLNKFFEKKKLVGNNTKYDFKWLRVKGKVSKESLRLHWDNMQGTHAINELQYNSLKSDAWIHTLYGGYDLPLALYQEKYPACKKDYSLIPHDVLFPYATMDVLVSLQCYFSQLKAIESLDKICKCENGWSIYRALTEVTFPAVEMFTDMEINGMNYDWTKLKILSDELAIEIAKRKKELYQVLGMPETMNIDSGDQLGKFLEQKGWEDHGRSAKGLYLTNESAMTYWLRKGHKEVELLNGYTECVTMMKTFVGVEKDEEGKPTGFWQYKSSDNKIHGSFATMMADSHRNKSSNPNLQNLPASSTICLHDMPLHELIRACFSVPSSDYYINETDGCGLQLRLATTASQDEVMIDIFKNQGGDLHSRTGNAVFCPEVSLDYFISHKKEKPYSSYRKYAKFINFSLLFGTSSFSFATTTLLNNWSLAEAIKYVKDTELDHRQQKLYQQLLKNYDREKPIDKKNWEQDQYNISFYWASAEDIRDKFFKAYVGLTKWQAEMHLFAKVHGYVQSYWGNIRRTPYLMYQGKCDDKLRIKNYSNIALNSEIQSGEAYYIMFNMYRFHQYLINNNKKSYLIGNVHDSFIAYIHKDEKEELAKVIKNLFFEPLPEVQRGVPYEVEGELSDYSNGQWWHVEGESWI